MKSLISVNYEKFKEISPKELVSLIKNSKYTKGVEICINNKADDEVKYLSDLVYELKKNDLILQVHGNVELSISEQVEFIKNLKNIVII